MKTSYLVGIWLVFLFLCLLTYFSVYTSSPHNYLTLNNSEAFIDNLNRSLI